MGSKSGPVIVERGAGENKMAVRLRVRQVLVLGSSGAGKTKLLTRYCEGWFKESYIATIGVDMCSRDIDIDKDRVRLCLLDTAGQERFSKMPASYYRNAQGVVLCFDITSRTSFDRVTFWAAEAGERAPKAALVLVGTKSDCLTNRVVSIREATELAGAVDSDYFETSALTGEGIDAAFDALARKILAATTPTNRNSFPDPAIAPDKPPTRPPLRLVLSQSSLDSIQPQKRQPCTCS